jgi:colicin import membrane protein
LIVPLTLVDQEAERALERQALEREKDALRIQAAAVAAQQAALTEEEARLHQRRAALEQQEKQLAAHLEEKRRQLLQFHEQTRLERNALHEQRKAHEKLLGSAATDLARERQELAARRQQTREERQRLVYLRRRLVQRWHRHWTAERQAQKRREEELAGRRRAHEKQAEQLHRDKADQTQARLHFNGERELGRRQLQAGWHELRQTERQTEERLSRQKAEVRRLERGLSNREAELGRAARELEEQQEQWQAKRLHLEKEVEGLENRAANLRRKVFHGEQQLAMLEATLRPTGAKERTEPDAAAATTSPALALSAARSRPEGNGAGERLQVLEYLAGDLADQRLHLTEQWERLLKARQTWQAEHNAAAVELDELAGGLEGHEQVLAGREQTVLANECNLRQRLAEVSQLRHNLEGCQARLRSRIAAWEGERDRLLTDVQNREEVAEKRFAAVAEVRGRWEKRRRAEWDRLQAGLAGTEKLRLEFAVLREEWLRRREALDKEERNVAEKNLALEQYRQECIRRSTDPPAVERRLERNRRRWAALSATAERTLAVQRCALQMELTKVEGLHRDLHQRAKQFAADQVKLAEAQAAWEQEQLRLHDQFSHMQQKALNAAAQQQVYERQVQELRDEIERVAEVILGEHDKALAPIVTQAA